MGKDIFSTKLNIIKPKYFQPLSQHTNKFSNLWTTELDESVKYIKS